MQEMPIIAMSVFGCFNFSMSFSMMVFYNFKKTAFYAGRSRNNYRTLKIDG